MREGRENHGIGYEAYEAEVMKSSQKCRSSEIRITSGCRSHKPERLGIDQ